MSEPAKWGGLKSPALVVLETPRYPTQRKIPRLKTIKSNQAEKGGIKPKAGVQTWCKLAFGFAEPSIHAGFKPSFKRFHTDHEKVQRPSRSDS